VSDQASAAVGATVGLYHIIRLHASRGVRNEETFWKEYGSLEAVWKELSAPAGAQGRSSTQSTRPAPLLDLKVGARLRVRRRPSWPRFDGRRVGDGCYVEETDASARNPQRAAAGVATRRRAFSARTERCEECGGCVKGLVCVPSCAGRRWWRQAVSELAESERERGTGLDKLHRAHPIAAAQ
jgi:hypothetical protein